jgi:hypothetical protein
VLSVPISAEFTFGLVTRVTRNANIQYIKTRVSARLKGMRQDVERLKTDYHIIAVIRQYPDRVTATGDVYTVEWLVSKGKAGILIRNCFIIQPVHELVGHEQTKIKELSGQ